MNHSSTSRETLLALASNIAHTEGLSAIHVRRIASAANIAPGTVYNYFPSKSDLIVAVIEQFWRSAIHDEDWSPVQPQRFDCAVAHIYGSLFARLATFRTGFFVELLASEQSIRVKGKKSEAHYFDHMRRGLALILQNDAQIKPTVFTGDFTYDGFAAHVLDAMISQLRQGHTDCAFLLSLIQKTLYD